MSYTTLTTIYVTYPEQYVWLYVCVWSHIVFVKVTTLLGIAIGAIDNGGGGGG